MSTKPGQLHQNGTLTITHNANNVAGSQSTISLSGTGFEPTVSLSPTSLNFGTLNLSDTSGIQTVTLTNTSAFNLEVLVLDAPRVVGPHAADFPIMANKCAPKPPELIRGRELDPSAVCYIQLVFRPGGLGLRSATLEFALDAVGDPHQVALSGTGATAPAPAVTVSPRGLDFGKQLIGSTSPYQRVALTNSGSAALSIKGVLIDGGHRQDFAIVKESCSRPMLDPGMSCVVYIAFRPTDLDLREAVLVFSDNAADSPQVVRLIGYGAN